MIGVIGLRWALMALLFVGGVMNVLWIRRLALLVLLEKLTPFGGWLARACGVACVAAGTRMFQNSTNVPTYSHRHPAHQKCPFYAGFLA
jgi:predicted metal-binding membrane protein